MKYEIFIIILAVFEESHPLNPEILKYDQFMKNFETTGRRLKEEAAEKIPDGVSVMKRESDGSPDSISSLPKPDQSLESMIKEGSVLVDKTKYLEKLVNGKSRHYFLARPDGFGKTIFLRTVQKFFLGEKEFFRNTSLYERGNRELEELKDIPKGQIEKKWIKYPVVYFNFASIIRNFSTIEEFEDNLMNALKTIRKFYNLNCDVGFTNDLYDLLWSLYWRSKLPVVVLVDDYDAPSNYVMHIKMDETLLDRVNEKLGEFFQTLRNGRKIRFVLVTGVLRLVFNGVFGGMDTFHDLTFDNDFGEAFGFTETEVTNNLYQYVERLSRLQNKSAEDLLRRVSEWYGNYRFSLDEQLKKVIHPASAIKCLEEGRFSADYVCANRPVLYIIQKMYDWNYSLNTFENRSIHFQFLYRAQERKPFLEGKYSRDRVRKGYSYVFQMNFCLFMLHHGYLKIESVDREKKRVLFTYPNVGVKEALKNRFEAYVPRERKFIEDLPEWTRNLRTCVLTEDIPGIAKLVADYDFFSFTDNSAFRADVMSRIIRFFQSSKIRCGLGYMPSENVTSFEWFADVRTFDLPKNYIFRITYEKRITLTLGDLIEYVTANYKTDKLYEDVYLVVLKVTKTEQNVNKWISVPYSNGELQCDKMQAESVYVRREAKRKYCKRQKPITGDPKSPSNGIQHCNE